MTIGSRLAAMSAPTGEAPRLLAAAAPRVVVVGDMILDGWWRGRIERMAREAPAPVVDLEGRDESPGGAANTALNAASLGARVAMLSLVGEDGTEGPAVRLRRLLEAGRVDCSGLLSHPDATTTTKSRLVAGEQIIARIDESGAAPSPAALARLADRLPAALTDADAVVVCDYGLGSLDGKVRETLVRLLAGRGRPNIGAPGGPPLVVVDAHDPRRWSDLRPDLATPNAKEALGLLAGAGSPGTDRPAYMRAHREQLLAATGARCVVVTMDRDGTLALPGDDFDLGTSGEASGAPGRPIRERRTWARPAGEKQASGAGDTFVACLTVAFAAGLPAPSALDLAQAAADVVVRRQGTSVCTTADLQEYFGGLAAVVSELDELVQHVETYRQEGRRVVLTNGCFDVLHRGHTRSLEQARLLGDVLVVAVNDDESVRRLKGEDRPINTVADRTAVLAALSCVDHVTVFSSDTAVPLIERLRPDVYAKGGNYRAEELAETPAVEAYGGSVVILDYVPDRSTTAVVRRIRAVEPTGHARGVAEREPV